MNKSVFGLNENLAAALSYVGIFFSGIVVLVLEKESKFVRFAALQSTVFFLAAFIIMWAMGIFTWIPLLGWLVGMARGLVGLATFLVWIYLLFTSYKGHAVKLPILGDICWEQVHK